MSEQEGWRRCNACKTPIDFGATYYVCNVSTCNRKRTGLAFCSVSCWEVHLPSANHRESWALERRAPSRAEAAAEASAEGERPKRRTVVRETAKPASERAVATGGGSGSPGGRTADAPDEVLIIASRLKEYVRAVSGMNTSDRVLGPLSDIVRSVCEKAIENARLDGRKTVLDRDVPSR